MDTAEAADTDWTPPHFWGREARDEWEERVSAWVRANEQLAADWDRALADNVEFDLRRQRVSESGLPTRAIEAWMAGLDESKAVVAARAFVASRKTFLLLMGSPGCGKTVATACVLERGGMFCRAVEASRLSLFQDHDVRLWWGLRKASALVLDDLGAEIFHDNWRTMLDELVDVRYGERLKTVITTNLDAKTFKGRYGVRIADRIRGDGSIESCGDKSRRSA